MITFLPYPDFVKSDLTSKRTIIYRGLISLPFWQRSLLILLGRRNMKRKKNDHISAIPGFRQIRSDVKTHHNLSWFDFLAFLAEVFAYLVGQAKYETEKE